MSPQRIQRKRVKGWRKPEGAICVTRPGRWGNPFKVISAGTEPGLFSRRRERVWTVEGPGTFFQGTGTREWAAAYAVRLYRRWLLGSMKRVEDLVPLLRGHDLCCYCPLDQPCHADVLLELANGDPE
ncbi:MULTISPECIES: DUF4326 domain-containing protein [Mycobacteroides]|jgi:Domain of unknown function (DUF4326)|uniref:DUF4326 domain-containing protein n=2 Tax=Mycobacteroides TaxID=670516 RepID=A0ABR5LTM9_9MYCO|nr:MULTISPECIES: DUF4326 domain-containing protein [Mycobacteroides]KPG34347.1 hypothetical protein AN912_11485 [Mycobacteroides immunogenum]ORB55293.1 hypothetical protein BST43_15625 [Mycobacteroides saopaulense]SKN58279.1 Uncharacterised protein [Mycobacteroides abscessus subsp. massiliense]SKR65481.1 Uncharacterised protein [Mycobacteroides abscessus subsp. abscessus]SLH53168.1 Uncharacterised protein [Mycobacteroides abscessus subsp. massiliense]